MFITLRSLTLCKSLVIPKNHSRRFATTSDPNWYKTLGIVPDVIDGVSTNQIPLKVEFAKGEVKDGNVFHPSDVAQAPKVTWSSDDKSLYTLVNVDPDAPSRSSPQYREWRHWLVTNIPSNKLSEGTVNSTYKGAGPPKGTGLHRYVFLLYKQSGPIKVDKMPDEGMARASWKVKDFAAAHKLGLPVGIAAYQAQNV